MADNVGSVLARKVREYREGQGLTQQQLADRTKGLGHHISRVTVAKIEIGGTRADNISLVDALVLAAALDVPPPLLFLPLGDEEEVAITPSVAVHPQVVASWIAGDQPFAMPSRRARNVKAWGRNAQPLFMFRRLAQLQTAVEGGDGTDEDFARLAEHLEYMERAGLQVPELPASWHERMKGTN